MLDADLRRAQDMARRMQRNLCRADLQRRTVFDRRYRVATAQPMPGDGGAGTCENVPCAAVSEMIPMRMRDERGLHRLPGVDVKIARRTVEAAIRADDERFFQV